jgi:hypothetical protein
VSARRANAGSCAEHDEPIPYALTDKGAAVTDGVRIIPVRYEPSPREHFAVRWLMQPCASCGHHAGDHGEAHCEGSDACDCDSFLQRNR